LIEVMAATAKEKLHYRGRYVIRIERKGNGFVYDVLTRGGLPVAAGFDMLSVTEAQAVEGIAGRFCRGTEV
jgi:hypothetical protein